MSLPKNDRGRPVDAPFSESWGGFASSFGSITWIGLDRINGQSLSTSSSNCLGLRFTGTVLILPALLPALLLPAVLFP